MRNQSTFRSSRRLVSLAEASWQLGDMDRRVIMELVNKGILKAIQPDKKIYISQRSIDKMLEPLERGL